MAVEEAPHGARRERSTVFPTQQLGNLAQRDVDLRLDRRENDAAISLDAFGAAIATLALQRRSSDKDFAMSADLLVQQTA